LKGEDLNRKKAVFIESKLIIYLKKEVVMKALAETFEMTLFLAYPLSIILIIIISVV